MMIDTFQINKTRNTFADELTAAGFLRVLAELFQQQKITPTLMQVDCGAYFEITCEPALDVTWVQENVQAFSPARVILTPYSRKKLSAELAANAQWTIDYEEKKKARAAWMAAFKGLPKTAKSAYMKGEADSELAAIGEIYQHWDILRLINPAALIGTNSLLQQWYLVGQAELTGVVCQLLFDLFTQAPNDVEVARKTWRAIAKSQGWKLVDASASQFFNPSQGKGVNKVLPNNVGAGNLKNFWLIEWLKLVGFYEIAFTRTMQGVGDRKTYVPQFGRITRKASQTIFGRFRRLMPFPTAAISSDILAVLRYTRALLEYVEAAQEGDSDNDLFAFTFTEVRPANFIHGFHTVFYKDLGNAVATMNVSFLNLPGWVRVNNRDDVIAFNEILLAHEAIVRQFDERIGDEIDLLQQYRDFIVADHIDPFLGFTTAYSSYWMSQAMRSQFFPKQLHINHIRRIIMGVENSENYARIFEIDGFNNIAYAIRRSTVIPQKEKVKEKRNKPADKRYTVRYGLGRDLVRATTSKSAFIAALGDFMIAYNTETAQVEERFPEKQYPRRRIKKSDIQQIIELIDQYDSVDMVAKLLVAVGYADDYKPAKNTQE